MDTAEIKELIKTLADADVLQISKTATRGYTWSITISFSDEEKALEKVRRVDEALRKLFPGEK